MEREVYSMEEVCLMLNVGRDKYYTALKAGELPCIWIGERAIIPKAQFDKWLQTGEKT